MKRERKGEFDRVVLVDFTKEGPRRVDVGWRKEVLEQSRGTAGQEGAKL